MTLLQIITKLETDFPQISWNLPPDLNFGILTTNHAFVEGKKTGVNPVELATQVVEKLSVFITEQKLPVKLETKGPYINLDLTLEGWREAMEYIDDIDFEKNKNRVLIDFFSPNVGKKMHVGHIRSADIGESLRRILSLKYETVISNNHLGDWGIQFGMIIWGIKKYGVELAAFDGEQKIKKLYEIYVEVNKEIENEPDIKIQVGLIIKTLEDSFRGNIDQIDGDNILKDIFNLNLHEVQDLWKEIIVTSIRQYLEAEEFLNLNKGYDLSSDKNSLENNNLNNWAEGTQTKFDLIIGESYYIHHMQAFTILSSIYPEIFVSDGKAIYVDLEEEKLGRCYLISSEGYSLYHSRDIIARFVWAGLLNADKMISLADNRQSHSFKQVFAVVQKILDLGIFEKENFGLLTRQETDKAIATLKKHMAEFVSFGFMTLPEGAMSTRKGKIIAFEDLKSTLETRVTEVLSQKESQATDPDLVQKVSVATLKWVDLHRDRDQDVVFDFDQFLKFEGNTGVYQLYTYARVNSILEKNKPETKTAFENIVEKILELKKTKSRIVVAIEGRAGSGKSTFAAKLAKLLPATTVESDGFYLPKVNRSEKTLEETFDYDLDRLQVEVITPFLKGEKRTSYLRYNWGDWAGVDFDGLENKIDLEFENILIVEGCSALNSKLSESVDFKIWLEKDEELASNWAVKRDISSYNLPPQKIATDFTKWRADYSKYIEKHKPQEIADINVLTQDLEINFDSFKLLNNDELGILKLMYTLPLIIEDISINYKPHHLCNYLFKLATSVNSWYAKYSVTSEQNLARKEILLELLSKVKKSMEFGLSLLGIEVVEKL